ncbi:MAG: TerB family tellurite resistance protein [Myxococcales bacterium]|nr:TerB family tellurite resistance protein [Myxococcales bacterium]MCB9719039.1 TerB family tellurite resistance protein [Myxococcales bacterium]
MALSLQTQWTLVASGLVAHADHVLTGEECERLMAMVDAEVDGDEYGDWMKTISDAEALEGLLKTLDKPPADSHRQILEDAWLMAVVDGERADEEIAVLERVAEVLGVEMLQLEFWREAWTQAQHDYAETVTAALAWVLGDGAELDDQAEDAISEFVGTLPTTHEHREALATAARGAQAFDAVEGRLRGLSMAQRRDAIRRLFVAASTNEELERWRRLGTAVRLSDEEIEKIAED